MKILGGIFYGMLVVIGLGGCENTTGFKSGDSVIVSRKANSGDQAPAEKLIWLIAPTESNYEAAAKKFKSDGEILDALAMVVADQARIMEGPELAVFLKQSGKYAQIELNLPKKSGKGRERYVGYVQIDQVDIKSATP